MTYHLDDSAFITAFSKDAKPVLTAPDGAIVRIRTMDCYSNNLRADNDPRGAAPGPVNSCNPATGPVFYYLLKGISGHNIFPILYRPRHKQL